MLARHAGNDSLRQLRHLIILTVLFGSCLLQTNAADSNNTSPETGRSEPCSVKSSFLFTKEDATPGSMLLTLPTSQGEKWTLIEDGPVGYLELDVSSSDQSKLIFSRSPDIEAITKYSGRRQETLPFVLECTYNGWLYKFKQELIIHDVNEHAPVFDVSRPYNVTLSESSIVGSRVFSLRHIAHDPDVTGRITSYSLEPYNDTKYDGRRYFRISQDGSHVVLGQPIDYDDLYFLNQTYFILNLTATDNGSPDPLTSSTILTIQVTDADDQGPYFVYPDCQRLDNYCTTPYFQTVIKCGYTGLLRIYPAPILAEDRDTMNYSISYSISRVEPNQLTEKFEMNSVTGVIKIVKPTCSLSVKEILLTITATEISALQHSTSATLQVDVLDSIVVPLDNILATADKATVPNAALNSEPAAATPSVKPETTDTSSTATVPLTMFLLSFLGFIAIGSVVVYIAIRTARSKRKENAGSNGSSTTTTSNTSMEEVAPDCHVCKQEYPSAATCFRACSVKRIDQSTQPSPRPGSFRNKFRTFIQCSSDLTQKPQVGPKPQDMRNPVTNKPQSTFHFDDNIHFRPSPAIPGIANTGGFMNDPSTLGSMKHERGGGLKKIGVDKPVRETDSPMQENRFKMRFNNMVPEIFKAGNPRVRFDTSNLNPV